MTDEEIKQMWIDAWLEQNTGVEPDEEEVKALKSFLAKAKPLIERGERERIREVITKVLNGKATWIARYDMRAILEEALKVE